MGESVIFDGDFHIFDREFCMYDREFGIMKEKQRFIMENIYF